MLKRRVPAPTAVLKLPSVLLSSENQPTAVFAEPVVRLKRAWSPSAVLKLGKPPSGGGLTASSMGQSAKQPRAKAIGIKPGQESNRTTEMLSSGPRAFIFLFVITFSLGIVEHCVRRRSVDCNPSTHFFDLRRLVV